MNTPLTDADPTDFQKALKVCSKSLLEEIGHLGRENAELREEIAQLDKRIAEESEYADETYARHEALVEQIAKLKDENAALSEELKAQCVVNGIGGEREAKLLAELDALRAVKNDACTDVHALLDAHYELSGETVAQVADRIRKKYPSP